VFIYRLKPSHTVVS
jgi:hypothetical protein